MPLSLQYKTLFEQCDEKTLILTANQRLSRFVQQQFAEFQIEKNKKAWPTLKCLSLGVWQQQQWDLIQSRAMHKLARQNLISTHQEKALWQQIIEEYRAVNSEAIAAELKTDSLAQLASEAWHILAQWCLSWQDLPSDFDGSIFLRHWAAEYEDALLQSSYVDQEMALNCIIKLIEEQVLTVEKKVFFVGFDTRSPLQEKLEECISRHGQVEFFDVRLNSTVNKVAVNDSEQEILFSAQWAEAKVRQGKNVAVVFPKLSQDRDRIERIFNRIFDPSLIKPGKARHATGFNISAAINLCDTPLFNSALELLQLNKPEIERNLIRRILHSVFIGEESELVARSLLFDQLKSRYESLGLKQLRAEVAGFNELDENLKCDDFYSCLDQFEKLQKQTQSKHSADKWIEIFQQQLSCMAWPGSRELDTIEYQQLQLWPQILKGMQELAELEVSMSFDEALTWLRKLMQIPFQAQTHTSPVQILGLLEAAGMQFDALWLAQMTDQNWPEALQPNPLLPPYWQREKQMPRSNPEKELAYAKAITQRLTHSADEVIVSWSQWTGDEPLNQSPLIEQFYQADSTSFVAELPRPPEPAEFPAVEVERIIDEQAPEFYSLDKIRGGAQILKNQAACPFRAFAIHRLNARSTAEIDFGISPLTRGLLVHATLEVFWRKVQNQQNLLSLSAKARAETITWSAQTAWDEVVKEPTGNRLKSVEIKRTEDVIARWLDIEAARAPFEVIAHEKRTEINLSGLPINIRIDRVDRLSDGESIAVIDYKTGQVNFNSWQGERPDDPQVPLYALSEDGVAAAALASLKKGDSMGFSGVVETPELFSELIAVDELNKELWTENWPSLVESWRESLNDLAKQFIAGNAAVDPKDHRYTCQYCELQNLCRIRDSWQKNEVMQQDGLTAPNSSTTQDSLAEPESTNA